MIVNCGIVDMLIAVGGHESHQGWIDYSHGDQGPLLSGAACLQPFGAVLFHAVDSISEGVWGGYSWSETGLKKLPVK